MFASSTAINTFEQDLLGYREFGRNLASGIANRSNITQPYVVGIDARWGMGKTSAANLIKRAFEELNSEQSNDAKRVHVLDFSPWLSSSLDALVISYIGELIGAVESSFGHRLPSSWDSRKNDIINRYGKLIGSATGLYADSWLPGLGRPVSSVVTALTEISDSSTEEMRGKLGDMISNIDAGQIVIIVDDLDRMHPDEMRDTLTLVTTIGNLPRVTHILLYDRLIVDGAMHRSLGHGGQGGPTYLEKIVNLPTALPVVETLALRDFLINRLRQCNPEFTDQDLDRLRDLWRRSLGRLLQSPRDIERLTNSLAATWPPISDHADYVDFVGIEVLRVLFPETWLAIRGHRQIVSGGWGDGLARISAEEIPRAEALTGEDDPPYVAELVRHLFPNTASGRASHRYRRRSISDPDSVDVYFRFQSGPAIGRSALESILQNWERTGDLTRQLVTLSDRATLRTILNDLTERIEELRPRARELFVEVSDAGDALLGRPTQEPPALHDLAIFEDLTELSMRALGEVEEGQREPALRDVLNNSQSIALPIIIWQRLALRAGILGETRSATEQILSEEQIRTLGPLIGGRLLREASNDNLESTPMLGWLLQIWSRSGDDSGLGRTSSDLVASTVGLANIIDGLLGYETSSNTVRRTSRSNFTLPGFTHVELRDEVQRALSIGNMPVDIAEIATAIFEAFLELDE